MATKAELEKLKRLIKKHTDAQVALSWAGSQDPEDREVIESEAEHSEKALFDHINSMNTEFRL